MTNPQKRKGDAAELQVQRRLEERGVRTHRPRQAGFHDLGDLNASPFAIQVKSYADVLRGISEGLKGAIVQAENAGEPFGVAVAKRPRKPIGEAYAVMRLDDLARVITRIREGDEAAAVLRRLTEQNQ